MSDRRISTMAPVSNSLILGAIILLLGVLTMAYGYFELNIRIIYLGIFVTAATSWAILMIALVRQVSRRLTSRST